jgi:heptosyltransferase-3
VRAQSTERVVVVFPGALGDLLLALPALRALRARHAAAVLTLATNAWLVPIAALAAVADRVVALDGAGSAGLFAGDALPPWLGARPVVYSWLGATDEAFRARLAGVTTALRVFRVERGPGREHATAAYARAVGAPAPVRLLAKAGALPPPEPSAEVAALLAADPAPLLALHPGAGARAKRWDIAGFVQVARWWQATGGRVVVLAGPAEAGEPSFPVGAGVREPPLRDVAALLARVRLYVGNDSGVSHLAGAVGAAGVVLFGATAARRWRPLGGRLVALQARGSGAQPITLAELPVARVVAACRRRLALTSRTPAISVRA